MSNTKRPISQIAAEIRAEWGNKVYFGAKPYLAAMFSLTNPTDRYGMDSADSIVRYFLANASTFRGEKAKALKAELKQIIGIK
jgi:hypothetical protein